MGSHRKYVKYDKYSQKYDVGHREFSCEPVAEIWAYLFQNYSPIVADEVVEAIKKELTASSMLKDFVGAAAKLCTGAFAVKLMNLSLVAAGDSVMKEQAKARQGNMFCPEKNRKKYVQMLFISWSISPFEPMYWGPEKIESTDGSKFNPFGW